MASSHRLGSALSIIAMAAALGGCAFAGHSTRSASAKQRDLSNVGLAIRAQASLQAKDYPAAVDYAERAVEYRPDNAAYRVVLGNAYFASGRFASAEAAYKDSLRLSPNEPEVLLKLVLVTIAQGRNGEALDFLQAGRGVMDPGNYGLALALAGQPAEAAELLEQAARQPSAGPRLRQNLALAHALAGHWEQARMVVAQDIPANVVDARIQQWMAFASPKRASDQVASLVGVVPASIDPGQPVRLALRRDDNVRMAAAAPVTMPVPANAQPAPAVESAPALAFASAATPAAPPMPVFVAPAAEEIAPPPPLPLPDAQRDIAPVRAASFVPKAELIRKASAPKPAASSSAVVQLGAYSSRDRVQVAWNRLSSRYSMVRDYTPMSARFDGKKGTFYRLSIKGFEDGKEASALCRELRRAGGNCFVRTVAGDHPVRFASR